MKRKKDKAAEVEQSLATWAGGAAVESMASGLLGPILQRERSQRSKDVLRSRLQKLGEEIGRTDLVSALLDGLPLLPPQEEEVDPGDGWWRDVLRGDAVSPLRKHQGGVLVGFCVNVRGGGFDITVPMAQAVEPRILIVDPGVSGGELTAVRVGEREILTGPGTPISVFQPTSWTSAAQMRRAVMLGGNRLAIGESIEIAGKLDEPGRFRAVIWCVGFDERGRPMGAAEKDDFPTAKLDAAVVDSFVSCLAVLPEETRAGLLGAIPKTFEPLMAAMQTAVLARTAKSK
jgi:hypothetical protein